MRSVRRDCTNGGYHGERCSVESHGSLAEGLAVGSLLWGCSSSDGPTSVRTMQERGVILGVLSSSVSVETPHGRVSSGTLSSNVTWNSRKAGAAAFESSPLSGDAVFRGLVHHRPATWRSRAALCRRAVAKSPCTLVGKVERRRSSSRHGSRITTSTASSRTRSKHSTGNGMADGSLLRSHDCL